MSVSIIGPFTSNPFSSSTGHDDTIMKVYYELCRGVQSDTRARFAFYMWNYDDGSYSSFTPKVITDALTGPSLSSRESYDVKILLDVDHYSDDPEHEKYPNYEAYTRLKEAFGNRRVSLVKKKEMGLGEESGFAMHLKLITIDKITFDNECVVDELRGKTLEHVVTVSSANIWGESQYYSANDLILFHGDKDLYEEAFACWEQAEKDATPTSGYCEGFTQDARTDKKFDNVKWYYFPRKKDDVVEDIVKNMRTSMDTFDSWWSRTWNLENKTKARLSMAYFTEGRLGVAQELGLVDDYYHSDVKTVLRFHDITDDPTDSSDDESVEKNKNLYESVINELEHHEIATTILPTSGSTPLLHNKFLTFRGRYHLSGTTEYRKIVWTGSHNYTHSALRNNAETMVRIEDDTIYDTYKSYFDLLMDSTESADTGHLVVAIVVGVLLIAGAVTAILIF